MGEMECGMLCIQCGSIGLGIGVYRLVSVDVCDGLMRFLLKCRWKYVLGLIDELNSCVQLVWLYSVYVLGW